MRAGFEVLRSRAAASSAIQALDEPPYRPLATFTAASLSWAIAAHASEPRASMDDAKAMLGKAVSHLKSQGKDRAFATRGGRAVNDAMQTMADIPAGRGDLGVQTEPAPSA